MPSRGRAIIDYKEAERQFVVEGKSLRQIATDLGLKSNSSISAVARREDWVGTRKSYEAAIARRSYEVSAATVASERQAITDEAVLAGRVTIRKYIEQLQRDDVKVTPRDAQLWAAFLVAEMTEVQPNNASEIPDHARNVTPPDADLLRRVVEAARERVAPAGSLGAAALVESKDARPN